MESIKELYRIGFGPSSSHTMGPSNAAAILKNLYPNANKYEITLFNSLYLTGAGHMTNEAILNVLNKEEVLFKYELDNTKHPNTINFKLFENDNLIISEEVESVGGEKLFLKQYFLVKINKSIKKQLLMILNNTAKKTTSIFTNMLLKMKVQILTTF